MKKTILVGVALVVAYAALAGAAHAAVADPVYTDADCASCHQVGTTSIAFSKVDFSADGVDYAACRPCHLGSGGAQATPFEPESGYSDFANGAPHVHSAVIYDCGDCHAEYHQYVLPFFTFTPRALMQSGDTLAVTSYGYFLTEGSIVDPDLSALHTAHDGNGRIARLLGDYDNWDSLCAGCHGQAGCGDCHGDVAHGDHGGTPSCTAAGCHLAGAPMERPSCLGCHPDASGRYHSAEHVSPTEGCSGSYCHQTPDLVTVHTQRNAGFECAGCHTVDYSQQITAGATECADCHAQAHENIGEVHTASVSDECVACHRSTDVFTLHADAEEGPCAVCHAVQPLPASVECANCHDYFPVIEKHYPADAHLAVTNSGCGICHSLDLATEHDRRGFGCMACHDGSYDDVVAAWDKTCDGCHPTRHRDRDSGGSWGGGSWGGGGSDDGSKKNRGWR